MKSKVFEKPWPDAMRLSAKETTSGRAIDVVLSNHTTGQSFVSQSGPCVDFSASLGASLLRAPALPQRLQGAGQVAQAARAVGGDYDVVFDAGPAAAE